MIQLVELHYRRSPLCDLWAIKARVEEILETEVDCSDPADADKCFSLIHKQHRLKLSDGEIAVTTAILNANQISQIDAYRDEIQQSWRCREAEQLLRDCHDTRLIAEVMAQAFPPQDRVTLFHGVLRAVIDATAPDALVFKHTQQVVLPADYLDACSEDPIRRPGSLNVRFFNISNSEGDMIMDTRGLREIGLHDLQCHYRNLDPKEVARVLFNTAQYVFENGPVIESGHTVEGIQPGSKWRCQFEDSMLDPKREVLDLNPGAPYAAGNR